MTVKHNGQYEQVEHRAPGPGDRLPGGGHDHPSHRPGDRRGEEHHRQAAGRPRGRPARSTRTWPCATWTATVIECDEIWSFCYSKQKNVPEEYQDTFGYGDVWTWTAIDADTKLVPSWLVGERTNRDAYTFLSDLKTRLRNNRVQITTDGHTPYLTVIEPLFGADNVDFAMLHKIYGTGDQAGQRPPTPTAQPRAPGSTFGSSPATRTPTGSPPATSSVRT